VHGTSRVQVAFDRLRESIPQVDPSADVISMWSWCRECNQLTPVVPMSEQTYHMSFAKYLEMTFFANEYEPWPGPPIITVSCPVASPNTRMAATRC